MEELPPPFAVDEPADRNAGGSPWQVRRRLMFGVVFFSMGCITWALWKDTDTTVMQSAVTMGFNTLIAITGTYVFGAAWSDKKK